MVKPQYVEVKGSPLRNSSKVSIQNASRPVVVYDFTNKFTEVARKTEAIAIVNCMSFSNDGAFLAVGSDRNLRAYQVANG